MKRTPLMKRNKRNKGVTLIALVITIIVLLILAAVSISMLTGENGVLTQSGNARNATSAGNAIDNIDTALNAIKTNIAGKIANNATYEPKSDLGNGMGLGILTESVLGSEVGKATLVSATEAKNNDYGAEGTYIISVQNGSGTRYSEKAKVIIVYENQSTGTLVGGYIDTSTNSTGGTLELAKQNDYSVNKTEDYEGNRVALTTKLFAGTTGSSTWTMSADRTQVTNGTTTLDIGSAVSGYSVEVDGTAYGDGNWYVLGAENGNLLITTNTNVGSDITLSGKSGYVNGVSTLNTEGAKYKDSTYAESARSINADDINSVTGYDPTTYTEDPAYGSQKTYTAGKHIVNGEWKTASSTDPITITSTYYKYTQTASSPSSVAYNMLFGSSGDAVYWLSSSYLKWTTYALVSGFGLHYVYSGGVSGSPLRQNGLTKSQSHGFRPAVILKSTVNVDSTGKIS